MNKNVLQQIVEFIETFILLKQQNLIIYSWMQIKKRNKTLLHHKTEEEHDKDNNSQLQLNQNRPKQKQTSIKMQKNPINTHLTPRLKSRSRRLLTQNEKQIQIDNKLNQKMSDRRFTFTDKSTNKNKGSRGIFLVENQQVNQDSQQFQDIVLERLSKLEETIINLMKEKKEKEEKRGYLGKSIIPFTGKKINLLEKEEEITLSDQRIEGIIERKKNFFQSLKKAKQSPSNIIHNLKYIPVNRQSEQQPTANIQRIKNLIQYNYQQKFIDDIDYFNEANPRQIDFPHSRKLSTSLYMNRYNGSKQVRDKIHYKPNNIEMQTVIQPRKKYFRQGNNNTDRIPMKRSFISTNSAQVERNNLSSYN